MKIINKFLCTVALVSAFGLGSSSCSDFLEEYSQDLAKVEGWSDLDELLLGSAYFPPANLGNNTGNLDILHFMTDEISPRIDYNSKDAYGSSYTDDMFPFIAWQPDTGVDKLGNYVGGDSKYWDDLYKRINVCNMIIELIDGQPDRKNGDALEKQRVKGEAHFLRGAYYFFLVNLYGKPYNPATADSDLGVPVKLTGIIEDVEFERVPVIETYRQILSDLDDAEKFLSETPSKSVYRGDIVATNLLQSRVYLYMQNWEKAAEYAEKVLAKKSALLNLRTKSPGDECIYKESPETIFSSGGYAIASAFADTEGWFGDFDATYIVSEDMRNLYGHDDLRANLYIGQAEIFGADYAFRKVNGQRSKYSSYCTVSSTFLLRTPEAYLNYAEAMAYLGKDSEACKKLDSYLGTRMDNFESLDLTGNELIDFIREERAREFLLEGHRWFDLRRYTVCQPYPWSKTITHDNLFYDDNNYIVDYVNRYVLEKNDAAYTLPIPRAIRNFQVSLGNNPRPDRQPVRYTPEEDDNDDDYDW